MPLLSVADLHTHFETPQGILRAVDGVSLTVERGESVGLVGESGCGKSTLGKTVLRLVPPTSGEIVFDGEDIARLPVDSLRPYRRRAQMIFQDPFGSLNPRHTIESILTAPLYVHGIGDRAERKKRVAAIIERVGLPLSSLSRYPHEFSGGQRQRIGIARALAADPELIICDEAVSALDVSVKAQIVNLLCDLQQELGLALLFISHDLAIVEHMTHRVAVMYLGKIVEKGSRDEIFRAPKHPYTRALLSAVPIPDPDVKPNRIILKGDVPSPMKPPKGCRFNTRCPYVFDRCRTEEPKLELQGHKHTAACHLNDLPDAENPMLNAHRPA